jgi:hypothetical protein
MFPLLAALSMPAAAAPGIHVTGSCPGPMAFEVTGVPGPYALLSASGPGSALIPGGPCAGSPTGLSPSGLAFRGLHTGPLTPTIPAVACSASVQVLDPATCDLSPVVPIAAPPLRIETFDITCEGDTWIYDATANGWTSDAVVDIWQVLPGGFGWDEEHLLDSVAHDPSGRWDHLRVELDSGASPLDFVPSESTVFSCGYHDPEVDWSLNYALRIYDASGALADCLFLGDAYDAVIAAPEGGGNVTGYNPVSAPEELPGCRDGGPAVP